MTAFITHFCRSWLRELKLRGRMVASRLGMALAAIALVVIGAAAQAQSGAGRGEIKEFRLAQSHEGLLLTAAMRFELPEQVEDALYKGIPMYFVAEAQLVRERWYWSDYVVAQASRHMRLSYQPLTRRWRLSQSSAPFADSGLGVSLGQNFDELGDALAVMQRITRWNVASADLLDQSGQQILNFQFRLDTSQLPRPLQLSTVGRSGWNLLLSRSVRLTGLSVESEE
ncbi:DUF4390 domain-containing protein [Diaphorobacter ruginosibacter]|uniref:DUF4390 domain-containing protein n=1 Tax=Diaphorobacter ruginosibacter TaxID=1715720 RepID=UPI00333E4C77